MTRVRTVTCLHFDVQNTGTVLLSYILDGLDTGAIVVAAELCVLNEAILIDQLQEVFLGDKVVFDTVLLLASRLASSV
jgi:hypothetical protein